MRQRRGVSVSSLGAGWLLFSLLVGCGAGTTPTGTSPGDVPASIPDGVPTDGVPTDDVPTADVPVPDSPPGTDTPTPDDVPISIDTPVPTDVPVSMDTPVPTDVPVSTDTPVVVDAGCPGLVCGGLCIDPRVDPHHCGACATDCTTLAGVQPGAVRCVAGVCDVTAACLPGRAHCAGPPGCETDLSSAVHCGACGVACGVAAPFCAAVAATYHCVNGCTGATPVRCGARCVNVLSDPADCGACGVACPAPVGALAVCASGACSTVCLSGYHRCGAVCAANTALTSCGSLCTPCPVPANATATCDGALCGFVCTPGYHRCGGACLANTAVTSCGALCAPCSAPAGGVATCNGVSCGITCNPGTHACGGTCAVNTAVTSCGALCVPCGAPLGAVATCNGVSCGFTCAPGYHPCGGACVANTAVTSCGGLCVPCAAPVNATATCNGVSCGFACNPGYVFSGGACALTATPSPPRPLFPPSTAVITVHRPLFRWALAAGTDGAHVDVCRNRACSSIVTSFDAPGTNATPPVNLSAGVLFWRLHGRMGTTVGAAASPVWEFTVGARSAPVMAAHGTVLDVNGDGYADVLSGSSGTGGSTGRAYVYAGGPGGINGGAYASRITGLDGPNGFFGNSVASAGDVNGDGYADVIVGAYLIASTSGRAYVYFGGPSWLPLSPSETWTGPDAGGYFGYSVAGVGDVNGDGYGDAVVGAYLALGSAGRAYLFLGSPTGLGVVPAQLLSNPDAGAGSFGYSVAAAGDVNADGYADVVIGANTSLGTGRAHVFLGSPAGLGARPVTSWSGSDPSGSFGASVAGVGDLNGDGYGDVAVGAYAAAGSTGRAMVFLGAPSGIASAPATVLTGPDGPNGYFGSPVAGLGDVNGDGLADLVVGAQNALSTVGRAYVYLGTAGGVGSPTVLTGPDGAGGAFGYGAAIAGDTNGDGYADVAIGAYTAASRAGRVYVYNGRAVGVSTIPLPGITGPDGPGGLFGGAVAAWWRTGGRSLGTGG